MQDTLNTLITGSLELSQQFTSDNDIIPGVHNNLLGTIITFTIGVIIRAIEKRRVIKKERKRRAGEI